MLRWRILIPAAIIIAVQSTPLLAAAVESSDAAAIATEAGLVTAPVEIDGKVLMRVRGASSYPAAQRAAAIRERIEAVAADHSIRTDAIRLEKSDDNTAILAGDTLLMLVTDADARLERLNRDYLANIHIARIRTAIDDYRRMRSRDFLLQGGLHAGGATVLFILGIALLVWLGVRLDRNLTTRIHNKIHGLEIHSFEIVRAEHIWAGLRGIVYAVRIGSILVFTLAYLHYVLSLFPWTRGIARSFIDLATDPLVKMCKGLVAHIPDLLVLFVIFYLFRFVLRLFRLFCNALSLGTVTLAGFDKEWAMPTFKLVRFAVVACGLVVAYPYIPGSQSAAFKGISLFIGVVFSLGSSSAVSNIIAGYMLTYRRAFKTGDRVQIGDVLGDVEKIRLQATHLRTVKNEEAVIPNSQILIGNVVNYSSLAHTQGLILHTIVGIGYETPWRQVEAMLHLAAERTPGLLREPLPYVLQKGLADFAVNYELNVYCDNPQEMFNLYTDLHRHVLDVFNEYGVQIMTPAYRGDPAEPKVVPREQWFTAPATPEKQ
jgi:small-conductance mechanosensitive channel